MGFGFVLSVGSGSAMEDARKRTFAPPALCAEVPAVEGALEVRSVSDGGIAAGRALVLDVAHGLVQGKMSASGSTLGPCAT